jgi:hypothetical protein
VGVRQRVWRVALGLAVFGAWAALAPHRPGPLGLVVAAVTALLVSSGLLNWGRLRR